MKDIVVIAALGFLATVATYLKARKYAYHPVKLVKKNN